MHQVQLPAWLEKVLRVPGAGLVLLILLLIILLPLTLVRVCGVCGGRVGRGGIMGAVLLHDTQAPPAPARTPSPLLPPQNPQTPSCAHPRPRHADSDRAGHCSLHPLPPRQPDHALLRPHPAAAPPRLAEREWRGGRVGGRRACERVRCRTTAPHASPLSNARALAPCLPCLQMTEEEAKAYIAAHRAGRRGDPAAAQPTPAAAGAPPPDPPPPVRV